MRHGESVGNAEQSFGGHGPTPLSERGLRQAELTGAELARVFRPTRVVSSDLARAAQTAAAIATAAGGLPVATTPALRERGLGRLDGMSIAAAQRDYPDDWAMLIRRDPDGRPGGGETQREVHARVAGFLDQLTRTADGERVVVVSHAFALYYGFLHILGIDPFAAPPQVWLRLGNCSITRVTRMDDGWQLISVNERHHLAELD